MEIRPILSQLMRSRTGPLLVAVQVAISLAILVNALFIVQQRIAVSERPSGIADESSVGYITSRSLRTLSHPEVLAEQQRELQLLRTVPGVRSVAWTSQMPMSRSGSSGSVRTDPSQAREAAQPSLYSVQPPFVSTLGLRLVEGRDFTDADLAEYNADVDSEFEPPQVIITEALGRALFPNETHFVGRTFYFGQSGSRASRVIGVVERLQTQQAQAGEAAERSVLMPFRVSNPSSKFVIRSEPGQLESVLRDAAEKIRASSSVPVRVTTRTVTEDRTNRYKNEKAMAWMLIAVSALLLLVTVSGIVGMTMLRVAQRRKQIGVRRALGARWRDILRYFVTENLIITTGGIVAGLLFALGLNRMLIALVGVPRLPLEYLAMGAVALWALGIAAVYGPAARAASISPRHRDTDRLAGMPTVLVIDDNASIATALDVLLSLHEIATVHAASPDEGLGVLAKRPIDLVIQDMNFAADTTGGEEGRALFGQIRDRHPDLPVILLTAWTHLDMAVDLVKAGAADYVAKPWNDERLVTTVRNLLELGEANRQLRERTQREARRRSDLARSCDLRGLVWRDTAMERVLELACQVARADVPVLITGPNGSGKERIAEIIQANSSVKDGPFVTLNCGAIPADLIEAELFGAEAGSYTGATKSRAGKFEASDGGTLFLDEIGNLPLGGQVKLLRVLETGRFQRLGSNEERQVRVRVISATNADLQSMIRAGAFRQDLYYRLNVIEIALPPLARRPDDILVLAEHFLGEGRRLDEGARHALTRHAWPGNVRELKNVMQRASLLSRADTVSAADLGLPAVGTTEPDAAPDREAIEGALARNAGVIAQAAAELGLSRQALYRRMERLGINRSQG